MSLQYGNGGIITDIYRKYHQISPYIELTYSSVAPEYSANDVFQWVDEFKNGFHSYTSNTAKTDNLSFHFQKPFLLKGFSIFMCRGFRFPKLWKLEAKYQNNKYETVYESSPAQSLCPFLDKDNNCGQGTETSYFVEPSNGKLVDTIVISNRGPDTIGTYCLSLGAIEFFSFPSRTNVCVFTRIHRCLFFCFLFI